MKAWKKRFEKMTPIVMCNLSVVKSWKEFQFKGDVEEDEVVSFGKDAEAVIEKLNEWNLRRDVVSIIGMGGLGKITLAKKAYKDNFVKNQFDYHAWVDVSQDYSIKELLLKIVEALINAANE